MGTSLFVMMGIHSQKSVAAHCVSAALRPDRWIGAAVRVYTGMRISEVPCPERSGNQMRRDPHSPLRIIHGSAKAAAMPVAFRTSQF